MKLLDYFAGFLRDTVNLDEERLELLDLRVDSIVAALGEDDVIGPMLLRHVRQGSWAHRTIIRPLLGDEFDADILVQLVEQADWHESPGAYLRQLRAAFKRHADYADKVEKKNRCVRVRYEGACHVDVVPYVVRSDGSGWIVNYAADAWEETNPEGLTAWIKEKDDIAGGNLRRVLRLLKYLRDSKNTFTARSAILTVLVGERIQPWDAAHRYKDVPTTLVSVLEDLAGWLDERPLLPVIADPSCPGTTFHDRWTQEQYANFRIQIGRYAGWAREAFDEPYRDLSLQGWQRIFGVDFKAPTTAVDESLSKAAMAEAPAPGEEFIEGITHRRLDAGTTTIAATFQAPGRPWRPLGQDRPVIKGTALHFEVRTDVPRPFEVVWKVRNRGREAERANGLRGQLMRNQSSRNEGTLYSGHHYIDCYLVRDGVLLGTDRFVVRIV